MRIVLLATILLITGCSVENEPAQEKVTVQYDREKIKRTAADAGRAAKSVATGVANIAEGTGRAIKKEVGDFDVDVKVSRQRPNQNNTDNTN